MTEIKKIRGSAINGSLAFIKKKWGEEGLNQCLRDINLDTKVKDGHYYPDTIMVSILRWIGREKGMKQVQEAGKFIVFNLGVISWLVRFADIKTIAKGFPKNYREIYNFGRVEVDTSKEGKIFLRFYDVITTEEAYFSWLGTCEGALEISRTKGRVSITKRDDTGAHVEFLVEYE